MSAKKAKGLSTDRTFSFIRVRSVSYNHNFLIHCKLLIQVGHDVNALRILKINLKTSAGQVIRRYINMNGDTKDPEDSRLVFVPGLQYVIGNFDSHTILFFQISLG